MRLPGWINPERSLPRRHNNETNDRHAQMARMLGADGLEKALRGHPAIARLLSGTHYPHSFDEIEAVVNDLRKDLDR